MLRLIRVQTRTPGCFHHPGFFLPLAVDKIALLKRFGGNDTIIVEAQIFKGYNIHGIKYKEDTKADRKCYREREQDRNGSHLAAAAPVLFPYFVRDLFSTII